MAPTTADFAHWPPNYLEVFEWRRAQLLKLRASPSLLLGAQAFYATHPVEFINHWASTYDPRVAGTGTPPRMPFILFTRQAEMVQFLLACLQGEESGLIEKARDMGATWICCAFSVWLWLFMPGSSVGWGSRKEQLVDRIGDPDSIFQKMRLLVMGLPKEFRPVGFNQDTHLTYMKFINPENGATITGESGDNIGRGGRKLMYFKDESAHYERPERIEAALADNTRVQIDMSSVNGLGNVFHRRREAGAEWTGGSAIKGRTNVFVMDWRDHPAKSVGWFEERRTKAEQDGLLHIFAQEVERNYSASVEGIICPSEWVRASIDAHKKLNIDDSGAWVAGLDVADGGGDTNALAQRKGIILKSVEEWGERDTGATTRRAVNRCTNLGRIDLQYDSIGVGAGVKGESNRLVDEGLMPRDIRLIPWSAAAEVRDPDGNVVPNDRNSPTNKDFYTNLKAQAWWQLRMRFERTWRAVNDPEFTWDAGDLISISSDIPLLRKLEKELSQSTYKQGARMKMIVDKSPEGTKSPNLADAVVMAFWPVGTPRMVISPEAMRRAGATPRFGAMPHARRF